MSRQIGSTGVLRAASGALTAGETSFETTCAGSSYALVYLDITTLTLADADDEVDFYVQTTYDGGVTWVDCQNFHFSNADNGAAVKRAAVINGDLTGTGTIKSISGTNPVAGNEILETVPANAIWKVQSIYPSLVTDATVSNRQVRILFDDGTNTFYQGISASVQAASLTNTYSIAAHGITSAAVDTVHWIPIPADTILLPGYRFQTSTDNLQSGDDWGAPQFVVEEWHDPAVLTDGTMRDNAKSYDRQLGTKLRIKTAVTGATAPTYAYTATVMVR